MTVPAIRQWALFDAVPRAPREARQRLPPLDPAIPWPAPNVMRTAASRRAFVPALASLACADSVLPCQTPAFADAGLRIGHRPLHGLDGSSSSGAPASAMAHRGRADARTTGRREGREHRGGATGRHDVLRVDPLLRCARALSNDAARLVQRTSGTRPVARRVRPLGPIEPTAQRRVILGPSGPAPFSARDRTTRRPYRRRGGCSSVP
jgi:hypothetical protein